MRLTYTVAPQLSEDAAGTNTLFGPLSGETGVIVDSMQNETSGRLAIKPGTTQTLNMGTLNFALGCYLRVDSDCQVSINGGTPIQLFRASQGLNVKSRFFFEGVITSVQVTAPSTSNAYGIYAIWGDPIEDGARTDNLPPVVGSVVEGIVQEHQTLSGKGAPDDLAGANGDSYIDSEALLIYGPKADNVWPLPGRSLVGEAAKAVSFFNGDGPPDVANLPTAKPGDQYLDDISGELYTLTANDLGM
jgi:hypothetical protein